MRKFIKPFLVIGFGICFAFLFDSNFALARGKSTKAEKTQKYECPGKITLKHDLTQKTKFQLFAPSGELKSKLKFSGILLFDGHPKEQASLVPDNGDSDFPHKWTLKGKNFWLACKYASKLDEENYFIIKKLNKISKECVQQKGGNPGIYRTLQCK